MRDKISDLIEYDRENAHLDFKREQYPIGKGTKRNELIKDVMAMANNPSNEDKFIVIGIEEANGNKQVYSITQLIDDAQYQQLVNSNVEPVINFEYKAYDYQGSRLAYFRIYNNTDRPYLFKKELNGIDNKLEYKKGEGYIRRGTSTFILDRADFDSIYETKGFQRDRKSDLEITHRFGAYYYSKSKSYPYLDIIVKNKSNASISFSAELVIYKNKLTVKPDADIQREHQKPNSMGILYPVINPIHVHVTHYQDAYKIETTSKDGINIQQADTREDIFGKTTILDFTQSQNFRAELTLRSDEFTEGPLKYLIDTTIPVED